MVEFGTYSTFRGWVRVRVLGSPNQVLTHAARAKGSG